MYEGSNARSHATTSPPPAGTAASTSTRAPPELILQYGSTRSGSTFQYRVLCVALHMLHPGRHVSCVFGPPNPARKPAVFKMHDTWPGFRSAAQNLVKDGRAILFVSRANGTGSSAGDKIELGEQNALAKLQGAHIIYTQSLSQLAARGVGLVADYQTLLNLSDVSVRHLKEYLAPWTVLNQCCGYQMSRSWLRHLLSFNGTAGTRASTESATHKCAAVDLDAREAELMQSHVHQKYRFEIHMGSTGRWCSSLSSDLKRLKWAPHCERTLNVLGMGTKLQGLIAELRAADKLGNEVPYRSQSCHAPESQPLNQSRPVAFRNLAGRKGR